jgi:hypothetical protein
MKRIFGACLKMNAILLYTVAAWPLATALAKLLGNRVPSPLELAASRFGWKPDEGGAS